MAKNSTAESALKYTKLELLKDDELKLYNRFFVEAILTESEYTVEEAREIVRTAMKQQIRLNKTK